MIDIVKLCKKIQELYPDIGQSGIDLEFEFDQNHQRWVVDLKKDNHRLKTFLEEGDAEFCISGRQYAGLGIKISQFMNNIAKI
ncbi:MAG: hypothetical protein GY874_07485 [Desulfobacteraceae bacterium]|nr:hypothetical protein [Desulfobacteraceae bacterium]